MPFSLELIEERIFNLPKENRFHRTPTVTRAPRGGGAQLKKSVPNIV